MHVAGRVSWPSIRASPVWEIGTVAVGLPVVGTPLQKSDAATAVTPPGVPPARTRPRTRTRNLPSARTFASPRLRNQSAPPGLIPKMTTAGAAGVPALLGTRFRVIA